MRYTQALSRHCQADSHLLWVITAASIQELQEADTHTSAHRCTCTDRRTHVQNAEAHTDNQCGIKVIESWQISAAAAESLTWGCWIDKPSIGTLLAFSSFWEEQNERQNCANAITSLVNIKSVLILQRQHKYVIQNDHWGAISRLSQTA